MWEGQILAVWYICSILTSALTTIAQEYASSEDDDADMQDCNADELQWGDDMGAPSNLVEIEEDTSSESDESFNFDEVSS